MRGEAGGEWQGWCGGILAELKHDASSFFASTFKDDDLGRKGDKSKLPEGTKKQENTERKQKLPPGRVISWKDIKWC